MFLAEFRSQAKSLPDLLPWGGLIDDGIVLLKSGGLLAGFSLRGPDLDSATAQELGAMAARVNGALLMSDGWAVFCDAEREVADVSLPPGHFPDRTTALIDDARRVSRQGESAGFETRITLYVVWHPDIDAAGKAEALFVEGREEVGQAQRNLDRFKKALEEVEDRMGSVVRIERLRDSIDARTNEVSSELLGRLSASLTFERRGAFRLAQVPFYLDAVLGQREFVTGFEPRIASKTILPISVIGYPGNSFPGILDFLGRLPITYRWSNRFIFLSQARADSEINKYRGNWAQKRLSMLNTLKKSQGGEVTHVNTDADEMAADAVAAAGESSSGLVRFGYYTSTILLAGENVPLLREQARLIVKELINQGFDAKIEDVNAVEAVLGAIPGNCMANVRRPLINTLNLAHLLPFTSVWPGLHKHPCPFYPPGSPPLLVTKTSGSTPYKLCLHAGDLGHTAIVGPTGSGKSTLLGSIVAAHFRYEKAQAFVFDKGYSMLPLALACGGQHYDIAGDDDRLAFCPLAGIDTESEQSWAAQWVESLLSLQNVTITPEVRKEVWRAVTQLAAQSKASEHRTLTELRNVIQDQSIRAALDYYTVSGAAGHLLDAESDSLQEDIFQVFEMEHLLNRGQQIVLPVLSYLFHRLEQRFKGQPTLLVLDEAWIMLGHPVFREKIREWLKVLRKANVAVIFATQSLTDLTRSGIADVVFESCPSKILLPNAEALTDAIRPLYESIGLNERQIEIIARSTPKRQYYHIHPDGRRLFELGLSAEELAFVGVSDKAGIARVRELAAAEGPTWVSSWLHERGLGRAAQVWAEY